MHTTSVLALLAVITTYYHYLSRVAAQSESPLTTLPLSLNNDESFNFQLLILLGSARYQGASIGEVLAAAKVIEPGSFNSFSSTFFTLAENSHDLADSESKTSSAVNNRDLYFAAASYYRYADFYLHGNWSNPLIYEYWQQQTTCFDKAIASLPVPGVRVTVPADGFSSIGIFYGVSSAQNGATARRPTLLLGSGYDAAQEDSLHQTGLAALERGWNVMTYEGPGQPTVRREQNLGFIPDWEKVVTPLVDYLANRTDVDMSRLALCGVSLGGYLAARAAAFEPRIKALLLNDGVWNVHDAFLGNFGPQLTAVYESGNRSYFDAIITAALQNSSSGLPTAGRWGIEQGLWSFNTLSPYDWLEKTKPFTVEPFLDRIKIPVWVGNAVNDGSFPGQAPKVAAGLGSRATLHNFTGPASYHCEAGAFDLSNQAMFGWLEQVLPAKGGGRR